MMLTTPASPASSDSSMSRVKPLEVPLAVPPSTVSASPGGVPLAPLAPLATQSLTEVSIHATVIPPLRLSPPLCPVSLCRPVSTGLGHPREGQSASLLGGKFILLDELEGSTLHRCLDITSSEELVCKVSEILMTLTRCDLNGTWTPHPQLSACAIFSCWVTAQCVARH